MSAYHLPLSALASKTALIGDEQWTSSRNDFPINSPASVSTSFVESFFC
jgi:hypothetical protein